MTETQIDEAVALAHKLIDTSVGVSSHVVILEALLATFISVATTHSCCLQAAADAAMTASMRLASAAAQRPAGAPIH